MNELQKVLLFAPLDWKMTQALCGSKGFVQDTCQLALQTRKVLNFLLRRRREAPVTEAGFRVCACFQLLRSPVFLQSLFGSGL